MLLGGWPTVFQYTDWYTGRNQPGNVHSSLTKTEYCTHYTATLGGHWHPKCRTPANSQSHSFHIFVKAMRWTSRTESQRAGGLILSDKQPLSTWFLEWEGKTTRDGRKNLFQRPSKSQFLPSLSLSIPCCHHFIRPLSAPFWGEVGGKWGGGGLVYLTLICSVVSFGEMTCNLGGKGQLFPFPSSESQFTAPGDFFLKLRTISGLPHCFWFTQLEGAKKEAPLLSSFSVFPPAH